MSAIHYHFVQLHSRNKGWRTCEYIHSSGALNSEIFSLRNRQNGGSPFVNNFAILPFQERAHLRFPKQRTFDSVQYQWCVRSRQLMRQVPVSRSSAQHRIKNIRTHTNTHAHVTYAPMHSIRQTWPKWLWSVRVWFSSSICPDGRRTIFAIAIFLADWKATWTTSYCRILSIFFAANEYLLFSSRQTGFASDWMRKKNVANYVNVILSAIANDFSSVVRAFFVRWYQWIQWLKKQKKKWYWFKDTWSIIVLHSLRARFATITYLKFGKLHNFPVILFFYSIIKSDTIDNWMYAAQLWMT